MRFVVRRSIAALRKRAILSGWTGAFGSGLFKSSALIVWDCCSPIISGLFSQTSIQKFWSLYSKCRGKERCRQPFHSQGPSPYTCVHLVVLRFTTRHILWHDRRAMFRGHSDLRQASGLSDL
jgi:hypothetical protein